MKPNNEKNPVWYLALPAYQYNEDVNALAEAAGLRIIDANATTDRTGAAPDDLLPQVTLRDEFTEEARQAAAQAVSIDKMEAAIIAKVREQFRAMPYETQLAAYRASQGDISQPVDDVAQGDSAAISVQQVSANEEAIPDRSQLDSSNVQAEKIEADNVQVRDVPYESAEQQALLSQAPSTEPGATPADAKPAAAPRKKKGA